MPPSQRTAEKPTLSPAQLATNRANARKSTGPTSDAGKEVSRGNALKHGLTGAGIVQPPGKEEKIRRRAEA